MMYNRKYINRLKLKFFWKPTLTKISSRRLQKLILVNVDKAKTKVRFRFA